MSEDAAAASRPKSRRSLGRYLLDDFALFRRRAATAGRWFRARYFIADPRSVGLTRIVIGLLLCVHCLRHWTEAQIYYSNDGVLSNDWHLYRPSGGFNFSLFHSFSSLEEVHVAFALSFACYFLFAIGWHARLFNVLSAIWISSLDNRLVLIENGGYVVVNLIVFWLMFLPTGQRFSIDSLRRSFRERREKSVAELKPRDAPWLTEPRVSLIAFIVILNLAIVYIFNVVNKYGSTWRSGETLHFVLHLDRMITLPAVWFRELLPLWSMRISTWIVLLIEALIVLTIAWPTQRRITRPIALVLIAGLHTCFGLLMRLGPFSWFLIGWSLLLLQRCHWEALERWHVRRNQPVTVLVDDGSPLALFVCRWLRRLDRTDRLTFERGADGTFITVPTGDAALGEAEALWAIGRVLPGGGIGAPALRFLSLGLAGATFGWMARHERGIARFFGLDRTVRTRGDNPAAALEPLHLFRTAGRELVLTYLLLCATSQLINENKSIPKPLKHKQPKIVQATLRYPRIFQGWGMFSPNPIREDGILGIDAVTVDGRHLDPLRDGNPSDLNLSDDRGSGLNQIQQDYANRIRLDHNKRYRKGLREYLGRWHELTGRPEDEIIGFNVYWLRDRCPEPGKLQPTDHEKICLLSWHRPRLRRRKGIAEPPPRCRVKSAGK